MTREERRESIRRLVDAAPLLPPEDIDRLRSLMPGLRQALTAPVLPTPRPVQPAAA
ncbi:hypothetical protein [Streptomyces sp. HGB0020]|uniref:hypothetical protein n=1 Tax=Streptomyces sp. HGB0020 TaxID=1078086 RepID=UPI00034E7840|nr:hypothetical protein [Streptomyces sp. HGB0020]EPD63141.1 hypothetical protein HMPREF1211_03482 [Streptomyces sp. HGB0020]